ncbi:MAG: multidrug transporter subunit MdtC [Acidobacteria bacterium]|nr:MAG: multidrug transporter subunit MdtC [Acidobacteriota bacterium]
MKSISEPFIKRPIATTLLTIALLLAGGLAYFQLPVSSLPQVDFPVISVGAALPGASPETMASSVATPLERQFGRIAGVNQMTSASQRGSTGVTLQFDLNRNIDAAARDVQAAINAARGQLPTDLPNNPSYRKVNPADAPILILGLQSDVLPADRLYDICDSILAQKLAQMEGVGQVFAAGASPPAVRIEANPFLLNNTGVGLDQIRAAIATQNANRPKGSISDGNNNWTITANDQLFKATQYRPVIIAYRNGAPLRLSDVADVQDSVQDTHNAGNLNGKTAVLIVIFRQPGANIISTVDRVKTLLPQLQASIPASAHLKVVLDRTTVIRASVRDVEDTLMISVALVVMVVFLFLRNLRATFIPSVVVPLSIVGTFGVMYLFHYSLDNLSLMALTISTGFVVDDAIVVIENIMRHVEAGMTPMQATMLGAKEIGFTVITISLSLIAVFIPILLMGGIVGRLFHEFAVTLSAAILVSLVVSLTTSPMLCARLLRSKDKEKHGALYLWSERGFQALNNGYARSLRFVLQHRLLTLASLLVTIALNIYLFVIVPKGFFPQQDTGRIFGGVVAQQDISFTGLHDKMDAYMAIIRKDPAVENVLSFAGSSTSANNAGRIYITLKPLEQRDATSDEIIARLRPKLARVPGSSLFLQSAQELQIGGRVSNAQYQYTLQSDNLPLLNEWAPRLLAKMQTLPQLKEVNSDQQVHGLQMDVTVDRDAAARLGVTSAAVDNALYGAFGQAIISTIYRPLNQYRVVMEMDPRLNQSPDVLNTVRVKSQTGAIIPLAAFAKFAPSSTPLSVNHQGLFPAITISFNLTPGISLGEATRIIDQAQRDIAMPSVIRGNFQGTAAAFQDSLKNEHWLILAALFSVYIVLGILYESLIHPLTIISTLPSAGVGAILALMLFKTELGVIGIIGVILLIGIVKKNAIMMIDFALDQERNHGKNSEEAIFQACTLRFRPILMTTLSAMLGALPLALGRGAGSELRRPLGIAIVGGLLFSQVLTLYTTPVAYLYLDKLQIWLRGLKKAPAEPENTVAFPSI